MNSFPKAVFLLQPIRSVNWTKKIVCILKDSLIIQTSLRRLVQPKDECKNVCEYEDGKNEVKNTSPNNVIRLKNAENQKYGGRFKIFGYDGINEVGIIAFKRENAWK